MDLFGYYVHKIVVNLHFCSSGYVLYILGVDHP